MGFLLWFYKKNKTIITTILIYIFLSTVSTLILYIYYPGEHIGIIILLGLLFGILEFVVGALLIGAILFIYYKIENTYKEYKEESRRR